MDNSCVSIESVNRRFHDELLRYALPLMRQREDAEDAVQDALLRVMKTHGSDPIPRSWVFRTCHSACLDLLRRKIRRGRRKKLVSLDRVFHLAMPAQPDPVDQAERCKRLRRRARRYPYLARHAIDGASYQAIANERGVSLSMVKISIWKERRKLREQLAGMSPEMISKEKTIRRLTV